MSLVKKSTKIECFDHNRQGRFFPAHKLNFRPSVYGLMFKGNKVLLSRQWDGYDFPGGGVEISETVDAALRREFFEETGLKIARVGIVDAQTSFYFNTRTHLPYNAVLIYFLVKKVSGTISLANIAPGERSYMKMAEWVEVKKIDRLKFYSPINAVTLINKAFEIYRAKYE